MRIAIIHNPRSGGGSAAGKLPYITQMLKKTGIRFDLFHTRYHRGAIQLAADLKIEQYQAVVVAGGDGTNFQTINGLLQSFEPVWIPPLGILPIGSGNSFAKDLGIQCIEDGLKTIIKYADGSTPKPVDVLSFQNGNNVTYFINLLGLGFVTDVAITAQRFKKLRSLSYIIGVIYQTFKLNTHMIRLDIDGTLIEEKNCFVEFCNSRYTGGDMLMAPNARIDDGLMDVVIAKPLSRIDLLRALPKIFSGTHINDPHVSYVQAKRCRISCSPAKRLLPDGELMGITPALIDVHPKLLTYLT
ncbi:MAG: diacylglycerol kinase family lipid kinase [Desulfobacteraceae bacterium]|nr:MAG: diacylglycerol kinase family lipid kinase [Desulfobacteraceae bacterium]